MVNTRVKDPVLRGLNRKLDRQKKARMRQNLTLLRSPESEEAKKSVESHPKRIIELKRQRDSARDKKYP